MPKIFISYRRVDSQYVADNIYGHMVRHFGKDNVFLDVGNVPFGVDFRKYLHQQIVAHDVVLVMIGPDWAKVMEECAEQPNDFVRIEIELALNLDKLVIPVLVKDATFPDFSRLPESIQELQWRHLAEIHPRLPRLEEDCNRLANGIKQYFGTQQPQPDVPPSAPPVATPIQPDILPPPFEWIDIPGGKVPLFDTGKVYTIDDFAIGKYPVTNAQFLVFVDAPDGYCDPQWWDYSRSAKDWRKKNGQPEDTGFPGDNHPRTNVTWFEAVAFCRWLSERNGQAIMLPTEHQWQRAAVGDTGWAYPWGDQWDRSRCNNSVKPFASDGTSPVTRYEGKGDSTFDVVDMSGNVWEWCLTDHEGGNRDISQKSKNRILRGGSWKGFYEGYFRADQRISKSTDNNDHNNGFRVSRS